MKKRVFKVGDKVTYKSKKDCIGKTGSLGYYYFGGKDFGGYKGTVMNIGSWVPEMKCYKLSVSFSDSGSLHYNMLESEFVEYDYPVKPEYIDEYTEGNEVAFEYNGKKYNYVINRSYLMSSNRINDLIFIDLGFSREETIEFCTKAYGYPSNGSGDWPEYKRGDYKAATRVIKALQQEILSRSKSSPLKLYDTVIFNVNGKSLTYTIQSNFLSHKDGSNAAIFSELGVKDMMTFCSKAYGYPAGSGGFPVCKPFDLDALKRVIEALNMEIDRQNNPSKPQIEIIEEYLYFPKDWCSGLTPTDKPRLTIYKHTEKEVIPKKVPQARVRLITS